MNYTTFNGMALSNFVVQCIRIIGDTIGTNSSTLESKVLSKMEFSKYNNIII